MLTNIRQPQLADINYLLDIDVKCFDDPIPLSMWKHYCTTSDFGKLVGTHLGTPIGFLIWKQDKDVTHILRLGVKPCYRRQGIGSQLFKSLLMSTKRVKTRKIQIDVPESLCCPTQPDDVSQWLIKRGFKTVGIQRNAAIIRGLIEDAFTFELGENL